MISIVGRDVSGQIPEITGKEVFQDNHYKNGVEFKKVGSNVKPIMNNIESKLADSIHDVLVKCGARDGMTVSSHHHLRDEGRAVNMITEEIHKMGLKDTTICASSLGKAHTPFVPTIENETVTNTEPSGARGVIDEATSQGKLKGFAIMRSHGGRVRAITTGETHIDITFIGISTCGDYGNCRGIGNKADCDVLPYSHANGNHADKVVATTGCLVPFPNYSAHVPMQRADHVCVVNEIGDLTKIATEATEPATDQRKLLMAEYCMQIVANTPLFKSGFSYRAGAGGASTASTVSLIKITENRGVKIGFGVSGSIKPMCDLLERGMARCLLGTQDSDLDVIRNVKDPNHFRINAEAYANPFNRDSFINKLNYVVPAALEVDVNSNCNIVAGSGDVITGVQGGHPDTTAEVKCTVVLAPLLQGRISTICSDVTIVTAPGESIDIAVIDYGVTVNPCRPDSLEALEAADCIPLKTTQELRGIVYPIVGGPGEVRFADRVIGIIRACDGTIMDVIHQIRPLGSAE